MGLTHLLPLLLTLTACTSASTDSCASGSCGGDSPSSSHTYTFNYEDPYENYNKQGIKAASAGELTQGELLFRAAALHSGHRSDVWSNLGLVLHQQSQALLARDQEDTRKGLEPSRSNDILGKMREAIAALDLAVWFKNEPAVSMRDRAVEFLNQVHPGKCLDFECNRYKIEAEAMARALDGRHLDAVNLLCTDQKNLAVSLSKKDKSMGILTALTARRLYVIMRVCGVVSIKDVYNKQLLEKVRVDQAKEFDAFYNKYKSKLLTQPGEANEWVDAAERGDHRYEVKFPLREPYTSKDFVANRFVLAFVKLLLGDRIEMDTFSAVTSLPGAPDQNWHGDVSPILERTVHGPKNFLPPQGVVTVVPLVKIDEVTGPTEFLMGSHANMGVDYWKDNLQTSMIKIHADVGSTIIFDLRITHRGTANHSKKNRPIVYMSYVYDWYTDKVNFKERQTKEFDEFDRQRQKLFTRLDSNRYVTLLENMLKERGVQLEALQSEGKYKKVNLHA